MKLSTLLFAAILAAIQDAASAVDVQEATATRRLVGGTVVPVGQHTYMSGLRDGAGGLNVCGGALLQ